MRPTSGKGGGTREVLWMNPETRASPALLWRQDSPFGGQMVSREGAPGMVADEHQV
jgi:hypothetical protein